MVCVWAVRAAIRSSCVCTRTGSWASPGTFHRQRISAFTASAMTWTRSPDSVATRM